MGEGVVPACSVQKLRGAFQISCRSLVEFKHKLGEVILQSPVFVIWKVRLQETVV